MDPKHTATPASAQSLAVRRDGVCFTPSVATPKPNAVKYKGTKPLHVDISAENRGDHWLFIVSDNGIGIPAEHHTTIFRVFKRLHGRDIPGTGIGLALCEQIVTHYGGRIWVESQPGEGSRFYMTLPGIAEGSRQGG